jgi:hypothetical protein
MGLLGFAVVLMVTARGGAAVINYGDIAVPGLTYEQVTETLLTGSDVGAFPLFGPPTVLGQSLLFSTATFEAHAGDGVSDLTASKLGFTVQAGQGQFIDEISLAEYGDYLILGTGQVSVFGTIVVSYLDGISGALTTLFAPLNVVVTPVTGGGGGDAFPSSTATGTWVATAMIDLEGQGILTDRLVVVLDNILAATAGAQSVSLIDKKQVVIGPMVPEPATLLLFGSGVAVILMGRRRRRR